jgi:6-phosphogluconate dehydrogenase
MEKNNNSQTYEIGMVGLGVMGRNLMLNMSDHGFSVAGYDKDTTRVEVLKKEAGNKDIYGAENLDEFISVLRKPRSVIMLVPAGSIVDSVIGDLQSHLDPGDLLIDAGNSWFKDTDIRTRSLEEVGIQYLGIGISGGEEGARHGPSIMPGGHPDAYERIRPVLEAVAAKYKGEPCVTYLGPGAAGHFVKMVHNGIEYAIMQLIAESYDLMKRGGRLNDDELNEIFTEWNNDELNGYLIEITGFIFNKKDEKSGKRLIDQILDVAKQKGTGMWTSQSAMELKVPIPTIDVAVALRNLSLLEDQRNKAEMVLQRERKQFIGDRNIFLTHIHNALFTGIVISFAQGMALLKTSSGTYRYNLNMENIASIWRGGCIIRSSVLEDIRHAFHKDPQLSNLLLDKEMSERIMEQQEDLRKIVTFAADSGIPVPGFMSALGYLDSYRSAWQPANLIQAQRDFFGSHSYERVDVKGTFHTNWLKQYQL